MKSLKLRTRLTFLILTITTPIFWIVLALVNSNAEQMLRQDAIERLQETNLAIANNVADWLDLHTRILKELTFLPDIISMDADRQRPVLDAVAAAYPYLAIVHTTDLNGNDVVRSDGAELKNWSDRYWFQGAIAGAPVTYESIVRRTSGKPALAISMPIRDSSEKIVGVVQFNCELTSLTTEIETRRVGEVGFAYIIDADNRVIAHPDPAYSKDLFDLSDYPPVVMLRQGEQGLINFKDEHGIRWQAYIEKLDNGWGIIVQQPEDELFSSLRVFRITSLAFALIGTILLLFASLFTIRRALNPIETLTDTALAITNGDLDRTVPVERKDEVGTLASAFNSMTSRMRELILSLEQRVDQLNRMQVALNASLLRQAAILDNIPDLAWLKDEESRLIAVNEPFAHACGVAPTDLVGKTDLDIWPEELANGYIRDDHEVMRTGKRKHVEERLMDSSGQGGWIETIKTPIFDVNGKVMGTAGIARDITERKRSESIVRLRLRLFEYAANHSLGELLQNILDEVGDLTGSPIGFYHFVEADQKTLSLQAWSTRTLKEYCKAEGKGMHYSIDEAGVWVDCVRQRQAVIHNDYTSLPHRKGLPDGHAHLVREMVVPVLRDDRIVAILGVGNKLQEYKEQDIEVVSYLADVAWELAERKHAEEEREELIKELETKNIELEHFTYAVSHDLKSPLVTINGFINYVERDAESGNLDRLKADTQRIRDAVNRMNLLLSELLELSRIGRMMNPPEDVPFDDIVREAISLVRGQLDTRQVRIVIPENLPIVRGDRMRLIEVLQNLIDNAIKFMGDQSEPQIEVGQQVEGADMDRDKPVFFVKDNGIGIAPEHWERVFGLFNQLDPKMEGTGIGLAIVKRIIEFHGGRIWVESEAGKGTTFYFNLPGPSQAETTGG